MFDLITRKTSSASTIPSPIALDLDGDGIETVSVANGTFFDHASDGFAELTGWVGPDDGFLVRDVNANGTIDSGRELFGSETLLANGQKAANGFEALKGLDTNADGVIDANDTAFAELRVWKDADGNGRTDASELFSLAEAGVHRINVHYTNSNFIDPQGNAHRQVGSYTTASGQPRAATDLWVKTDATHSVPTQWVDVPDDIAALPNAQGYGKVRDLHQAMAMDATGELKALVQAFTQASTPKDRDALATQIIYRWTGVQDVDPTSRASRFAYGNAIGDARKLEALEEFMGEEWVGVWCWGARDPNPHGRAAPVLLAAWGELKAMVYGQLMAQSQLSGLFQQVAYHWDAETETVAGDLSAVAQTLAARIESDRDAGLQDLGDFLYSVKGMGLLSRLDVAGFKAALLPLDSDVTQAMDAALNGWVVGGPTDSDDVLRGTERDDLLDGQGGNDRLFGRAGNDTLTGGNGDDTLDGGAGNDDLRGGSGADTYRFGRGAGHDTVRDTVEAGTQRDTVRFSGLNPADIRVAADDADNLVFTIVDTGETLTVLTAGRDAAGNGVGQYIFDNGTVWRHDDALRATVAASTANDDVIHGSSAGDTISGQAGNDTLVGHAGDDVIDGGAGNDTLIGATGWDGIWENGSHRVVRNTTPSIFANGNDTYLFGRGDGQDSVIDGDYTAGNSDTLRFKAGVAPADVKLTRSGNDLVLAIRGDGGNGDTDDRVTLKQYFDEAWNGANGPYLIERIAFADGTVLSYADVQATLFAGSEEAQTIIGSRAADVLTGQGGDDVLLGGEGRDTLDGGAGNDVLRGGGVIRRGTQVHDGNGEGDTYRFGRGDGHDTIIEDSWVQGETDRIEFKAGVLPSDVRLQRVRTVNGWQVSDDLKITIRDTGETITIKNHFDESKRFAVEEIAFADGTLWDADKIKSYALLGDTEGDTLLGFAERNDEIFGAEGNDALYGMSGNDRVYGDTGDDLLDGGTGSDQLEGREGRDSLYGREGDDALEGGDGDDQLYGNEDNDILNGGAGNDVLAGGVGADIYLFGRGSGRDVAEENASRDMAGNLVVLDEGISAADVVVRKSGNDLVLKLADTADELVLRGAATHLSGSSFSGVRFADGTEWDYATLQARALIGTVGDDRIEGFDAQSEVVSGGAGNDTLMGGVGADVYLFGRGDGQDVIFDRDASAGSVDTLRFAAGVLASDVVLVRDGRDLVARISDTGESITIKGFYQWEPGGWRQRIERMEFDDGSVWLAADMESRATLAPQDNRLIGSAGPDVLTGNGLGNLIEGLDEVDVLEGGAGNDTLVGGLDSDTLRGGDGDDVLYGLLQKSSGDEDASVLTPTAHYYLNEADNALIDGLSEAQPGFGEQYLVRNDDDSTDAIDITSVFGAQGLNFFGQSHTRIYINNNGNITFNGTLSSYTPSQIGSGSDPIIAPFWADVDTRAGAAATTPGGNSEGSNLLYYDLDAENGVLTVTWDDVGYYNNRIDKANAFQLQLVNRGGGDFDIIFRYEAVNWTTGDASGGSDGLGGTPVRAGYSAGDGVAAHYFEMPESGNQAAMLNLDETAGNTGRTGTHVFHVRNGRPVVDNGGLIQQGDRGINFLFGGAGNDTYIVDTAGDVVTEYADEGIDSIQSSVDFVLSDNVENLSLTGSRSIAGLGNTLDNTLIGNAGANTLSGLEGDDALDGGAGVDTLYGGQGADTLRAGAQGGQLFGEEGGDTYIYFAGDGEVLIEDAPQTGGQVGLSPNILVFGDGIRLEDVRFEESAGDLLITFVGQPEDRVVLRGYSSQRATQTNSVDIIRFADGREIVGLGVADNSGVGTLDVLADGVPAAGGTGSDVYRIALDGNAPGSEFVIAETSRPGDQNRIELSGEINLDDLHLAFDGRDLLLQLSKTGQVIRFAGFDPRAEGMQSPVSEINLSSLGISLSFDDLLARGVRIIGTPNDDVLTGTALADWIEGREADDTMSGGARGDLYFIDADGGADTIVDTENGDAPNTLVLPEATMLDDVRLSFDAEGFLILDLDKTGNRIRLSGFDPQNPLGPRAVERFRFGLKGNEIGYQELLARGFDIVGTDESDALKGTALTDRVRGGDGNDQIEATPGGDWLAGEGGDDTYVVHRGDGIVTIDDVAEQGAGNVLRFGPGIDSNDLSNKLRFEADSNGGHVLLIPYGEAGDLVRLTGFDPQDALGHHAIERFEFADGTAVDYATLVSWGFVVEGDNANNALKGTNVGDRLYGHGGDDALQAGTGSDELHGGAGSDLLQGAEGDDAYVFNKGDGLDTIVDSGATDFNFIRFGSEIRPEDIRHEWDGTTLVLHYSPDDAVRIDNFRGTEGKPVILALAFADGTVVSLTEQINRAPVALQQLGDTVATEDQDFSLTLPAHLFCDPDTSDEVKVVVKLANGKPLPAWLRFDPVSRTLSGKPANDDVGVLAIAVEGQDHFGASARIGFRIGVQNTADAPEVGTPLSDLHTQEDCAFSFTLPADSFRDVDVGDVLSYSATQADGSALPTWLRFNAATRTFSGTPANADVGSVSVRVTAADMAGAQASQTFAIGVANVNDAPEVGTLLTNQTGRAGTALRWQLPATAFVDVDAGDALSYSATLSDGSALPAWLAFDAATGTFSGTPPAAGHLALRVTATDLAGAQASQRFSLAVEAGSNQAPITAPDAATVTEDRQRLAWGNVLTNDRDPEGQPLCVADAGIRRGEYGVLNLLSNGSYTYALDNCSSKVQGLGAGETVTETFRYLASDGTQRSNGALTVTVQGTDDTPTLAKPLADVQLAKKKAFTWRVPAGSFVDIDRNDTLHYTATLANGKPLPNWLTFDAATQTFSGTAPSKTKDSIEVRITASDGHGDCSYVSDSFKIKIGGKTQSSHSSEDRDEEKEKEKKSDQECDADAWRTGPDVSSHDGASRPPERSRHDDLLQRFVDDYLRPGKESTAPPSSLDRPCLTPWSDQEHTPESGHRADSGQEMARRWAELTQALNQLDADRQGAAAWQHSNQGADLSGLTAWTHRTSRSEQGGVDSVSLGSVSGTPLVGLRGLREGLTHLSW